jgi:hypothetical protein
MLDCFVFIWSMQNYVRSNINIIVLLSKTCGLALTQVSRPRNELRACLRQVNTSQQAVGFMNTLSDTEVINTWGAILVRLAVQHLCPNYVDGCNPLEIQYQCLRIHFPASKRPLAHLRFSANLRTSSKALNVCVDLWFSNFQIAQNVLRYDTRYANFITGLCLVLVFVTAKINIITK